MTPILSYMGTKAALVGDISGAFQGLSSGPLLDVFAGMSAIGRSAAGQRNIWVNDAQHFSRVVNKFHFRSSNVVPTRARLKRVLSAYHANLAVLREEWSAVLGEERLALAVGTFKSIAAVEGALQAILSDQVSSRPSHPESAQTYRLFTDTYAGTYFGLQQCIEIDSIRYGMDQLLLDDDLGSAEIHDWMMAALGAAISRCSNSTGHFAQYLSVSERNFSRVLGKRRRCLYREWVKRLRLLLPVGTLEWRKGNRVYQQDACSLIGTFGKEDVKPAIIYADPPYTADQYSRFYHILDTLVLYDYPKVSGKGRYRQDRFTSSWSHKSQVASCFEKLIEGSAKAGSALVISYPENGLLENSERVIPEMLKKSYKQVTCMTPLSHKHSTMGASKGLQKHDVTERVFVAT